MPTCPVGEVVPASVGGAKEIGALGALTWVTTEGTEGTDAGPDLTQHLQSRCSDGAFRGSGGCVYAP